MHLVSRGDDKCMFLGCGKCHAFLAPAASFPQFAHTSTSRLTGGRATRRATHLKSGWCGLEVERLRECHHRASNSKQSPIILRRAESLTEVVGGASLATLQIYLVSGAGLRKKGFGGEIGVFLHVLRTDS